MQTIPDLKDPNVCAVSLILGFAYSLTPYGEPGSYNLRIADQMADVIKIAESQPGDKKPWIGMQWEIFDAIESQWTRGTADLLEWVPLSHIGRPPAFVADDIANAEEMVRQLKMCYSDWLTVGSGKPATNASTAAGRVLSAKVADLARRVGYGGGPTPTVDIFDKVLFDKVKLAQFFNRLVQDSTFHQDFHDSGQALVTLHNLYRSGLGSVGVEERQLPAAGTPLRRFQKIRVNRLIIEAIFPDEKLLKRGNYLSTRGVLEQVAAVRRQEAARPVEHGFVYGHPAHSPRCRRQLIESGWEAGWDFQPEKVYDVNSQPSPGGIWRWDAGTAQMWCRSQRNWDDYESMGKARLH